MGMEDEDWNRIGTLEWELGMGWDGVSEYGL
jgi:hypothetical protein